MRCSRILLASFLLVILFRSFCAAQPEVVHKISVKFEVSHSDGKPYEGAVAIKNPKGEIVYLYTNRFGLGFLQLLPDTDYTILLEGFEVFKHFRTHSLAEGDMELELTLPPTTLKGRTAREGNALVLFTYLDQKGKPLEQRILYCLAENGQLYTGTTDSQGKARVEVPLGHSYQFSVDGTPNFDAHTFTPTPPLQTAEIRLELGKPRKAKKASPPKTLKKKTSEKTTVKKRYKNPYRTRNDSLRAAQRRIVPPMAVQTPKAFVIPPREVDAPVPYMTSKNVLEGVYLLREVVREEERKDYTFLRQSRLTLIQTLTQHNYDSAAYVVDVTCSMDPYVEEYLLWLSITNQTDNILGGVFFNDGDGRPDSTKSVGNTGGIRLTGKELKEVTQALVESLSHGCSGDDAENDLEALLAAQKHYPQAKALVLVADNSSDVRDLQLLSQLHKPVHVILCSNKPLSDANPPNVDYVNIAYATGGTLSSLQNDLKILQEDLQGEQIRVGEWHYKKLKEFFVRVR